jgi:hypothetical protein
VNPKRLSYIALSLVLVVLFCWGENSFSASLQKEFIAAGLEVPNTLIEMGYTEFGDLDLREFTKRMRKVQIKEGSWSKLGDSNNDGRISARWEIHPDRITITVNKDLWNRRKEQRPLLALHEYLGALGFQDKEYWLSTELWFLTQPESHQKLTNEEIAIITKRIAEQTQIRIARGGGVVGVGGGGESATLWVRMRRIKEHMETFSGESTGDVRRQGLLWLFDSLEANVTVSYTTPKMKEKIRREAKKKVQTACLTNAGACDLPPERFQTTRPCTCPGVDSEGIVIYPY